MTSTKISTVDFGKQECIQSQVRTMQMRPCENGVGCTRVRLMLDSIQNVITCLLCSISLRKLSLNPSSFV